MEKIEETLDEKFKKYVSFYEKSKREIKKYSNIYRIIACVILIIIGLAVLFINLFLIICIYLIAIICLIIGHACLLHYCYSIWFEKKIEVYKNTFK